MKTRTTEEIVKENSYINHPYTDIDCNNGDDKWVSLDELKRETPKEIFKFINLEMIQDQEEFEIKRFVKDE